MLQQIINSIPFHLALSTSTFLLYLFNKYIIRAKEVKYINHKTALCGLIPYLNIAFLIFNSIAFYLNYSLYRSKRNYSKRFYKYNKIKQN